MIDMTHGIDQDLELDVTGLQSLSSPSGQNAELGQLGGHGGHGANTCFITVTCCQTCGVTACVGTLL
jgi:hypothetical protein